MPRLRPSTGFFAVALQRAEQECDRIFWRAAIVQMLFLFAGGNFTSITDYVVPDTADYESCHEWGDLNFFRSPGPPASPHLRWDGLQRPRQDLATSLRFCSG